MLYFSQNRALGKACIIWLLSILWIRGSAQNYLRGEVTDTHNNLLQNVTIIVQSSGQIFHTGTYGDFGVMSSFKEDTLTFSLDGYETVQKAINASVYLKVVLKMKPSAENLRRNHLTTFIKDLKGTDHRWK